MATVQAAREARTATACACTGRRLRVAPALKLCASLLVCSFGRSSRTLAQSAGSMKAREEPPGGSRSESARTHLAWPRHVPLLRHRQRWCVRSSGTLRVCGSASWVRVSEPERVPTLLCPQSCGGARAMWGVDCGARRCSRTPATHHQGRVATSPAAWRHSVRGGCVARRRGARREQQSPQPRARLYCRSVSAGSAETCQGGQHEGHMPAPPPVLNARPRALSYRVLRWIAAQLASGCGAPARVRFRTAVTVRTVGVRLRQVLATLATTRADDARHAGACTTRPPQRCVVVTPAQQLRRPPTVATRLRLGSLRRQHTAAKRAEGLSDIAQLS